MDRDADKDAQFLFSQNPFEQLKKTSVQKCNNPRVEDMVDLTSGNTMYFNDLYTKKDYSVQPSKTSIRHHDEYFTKFYDHLHTQKFRQFYFVEYGKQYPQYEGLLPQQKDATYLQLINDNNHRHQDQFGDKENKRVDFNQKQEYPLLDQFMLQTKSNGI